MELSQKALKDLRKALIKSIGPEATKKMSVKDLNEVGNLFLTILSENLKMKKNDTSSRV